MKLMLPLLLILSVLIIGINSSYAEEEYLPNTELNAESAAVTLDILLSENIAIVFDDNSIVNAYIGVLKIPQENIIRERQYDESENRVFGQAVTGEYVYIIYDKNTGDVKVKVWNHNKTKTVLMENGGIIPLF